MIALTSLLLFLRRERNDVSQPLKPFSRSVDNHNMWHKAEKPRRLHWLTKQENQD
jgi:hypothetical protein